MTMFMSDACNEIAGAMAKAQAEMSNPTRDAENPHFRSRFATLAGVRNAVVPILAKYGIAVVQRLASTERGVACETRLLHTSGQWIAAILELPVSKDDAQGYGSAATYARRYSLMAIACVAGDDDDDGDDGDAAVKAPPRRHDQPRQTVAARPVESRPGNGFTPPGPETAQSFDDLRERIATAPDEDVLKGLYPEAGKYKGAQRAELLKVRDTRLKELTQ